MSLADDIGVMDDVLNEALRSAESNPAQALTMTSRVLTLDPDDPGALAAHAVALAWNGRDLEACRSARRATSLGPTDAFVWLGLAAVHHRAERYDEQVAAAGKALASDPSNPDASATLAGSMVGRLNQGLVSESQKESVLATADTHAARALFLDPQHDGALTSRAQIAAMRNDFDTAEVFARQALALDPGSPRAHFVAMACCVSTRRADEAVEHLRHVQQIPELAEEAHRFALSTSPRRGAGMVALFVVLVAIAEVGGGWWWALMNLAGPVGLLGGVHLVSRRKFLFGPIRRARRTARMLS